MHPPPDWSGGAVQTGAQTNNDTVDLDPPGSAAASKPATRKSTKGKQNQKGTHIDTASTALDSQDLANAGEANASAQPHRPRAPERQYCPMCWKLVDNLKGDGVGAYCSSGSRRSDNSV